MSAPACALGSCAAGLGAVVARSAAASVSAPNSRHEPKLVILASRQGRLGLPGDKASSLVQKRTSDYCTQVLFGQNGVLGPQTYGDGLARRGEELARLGPEECSALPVTAYECVDADVAQHPLRRLDLDHAERVVEA